MISYWQNEHCETTTSHWEGTKTFLSDFQSHPLERNKCQWQPFATSDHKNLTDTTKPAVLNCASLCVTSSLHRNNRKYNRGYIICWLLWGCYSFHLGLKADSRTDINLMMDNKLLAKGIDAGRSHYRITSCVSFVKCTPNAGKGKINILLHVNVNCIVM